MDALLLLVKWGFRPEIAELYWRKQNCSCLSGLAEVRDRLVDPAIDELLCAQLNGCEAATTLKRPICGHERMQHCINARQSLPPRKV